MKRFWLVLLSLGLVLAFSVSALAVDVKFSGSYYAAGMYEDKTAFDGSGPSTAFYYQRLRLQTDFVVSPGLKLVTRMDIMERVWGANRWAPSSINLQGTSAAPANNDMYSAGTTAENENIAIDYLYVEYASPIGVFRVGYQGDGTWGTPFGDYDQPFGKIFYFVPIGPAVLGAYVSKFKDQSLTAKAGATANDTDVDMYCAFAVFNFKGGSAGLLWKMYRNAGARATLGFTQQEHFLLPYAKVQIGPVFVQAEVIYGFGDYMKDPLPALSSFIQSSKLDDLTGWIDATVDFGVVYFGASVVYVAGDDPTSLDKKEGGVITGGADYNPALILFNYDRYYWAGSIPGFSGTATPNVNDNVYLANNNAGITNAWLVQGRVGVRPVEPLNIMASVTWATVDKKFVPPSPYFVAAPAGSVTRINNDGNYGTEIDLTATYKITNNLSYMLGVGYLFTGEYFKGTTTNPTVNDFLVINKLTLTF